MTINLKTGEDYTPRREDYITKLGGCHLDPDCPTPLWTASLDRVTAGDKELQAYLKRMCGYCLTGSTREHVIFFLYGSGANGKSVFLKTLLGIWGDYAAVAAMETFIETKYPQHSTDLAMLHGARLVVVQEVDKGTAWAEAKLNRVTGGEPITARYMRQDFFTYIPKFKLVIGANHKPSLRSINEAARRRFQLIPFIVTIPAAERDKDLADKLKDEWPGVLHWCVQGCLEWQRDGLNPPKVVLEASEAYFAEEDSIARWIEECCLTGDGNYWGIGAELWNSWKAWSENNREATGSRKGFAEELDRRGFSNDKSQHVRGHRRIMLRPQEEPPAHDGY
jgi:putative DNA primase/helicase